MRDLIERQKAIDILLKLQRALQLIEEPEPDIAIKVIQFALREIEQLPSAEPEIVRCKDCEHWKNEHLCERLSRFGSFETKADFYCGKAERRTDD